MLIVLPLLLLCYGVGNIQCSTVHENRQDFQSLLKFKQGITDPKGALSNWTINTHFCRWNGVDCTLTRPWRVMELNLSGMGLVGQVSSSIGNLTFLAALDLSNNSFTGPLPILHSLQHLVIFYVNNNQLQGAIPDTLTNSSTLAYVDLSVNLLVGSIPRSISSLSRLSYLNLKTNQLEGSIPDGIANLSNTLTYLLLGGNSFVGTIPSSIGSLTKLERLELQNNNLKVLG
ncbi:putative inactive leucine-rich repeat receptor-like protein kinase [Dichanthelium oligosanthes]|uniref:Putative inactive leucine-rich repeat receptor-like protein kinase n=1 Tax=Dichanthelium oligosanthes TaxID=888268 RepID=A0A1E5WH47_9POAL|nr:putative inactive leucine-rich repeat receptor-like protein kinase [Dichanthelium oligosanthes]